MNWQTERYASLSSSNDLAAERIRAGTARVGQVIVTAEQTAGRGRRGRRWQDSPGALLFTLTMRSPGRLEWSGLTAAIAVAEGLRQVGAEAGVKWPNDVTLARRKVAGVLIEAHPAGLAAVGVGVNVNNPVAGRVFDKPAISLREHLGRDLELDEVLDRLLASFAALWPILEAGDIPRLWETWQRLDTTPGRPVLLAPGNVRGTALGVDERGGLVARTVEGTRQLYQIDQVRFLEE